MTDPPLAPGSILAAVDLGGNARRVADAAHALAKDLGCGVTLVHVFQRLPPTERSAGAAALGPRAAAKVAQLETGDAQRLTAELAEPLRADGLDVTVVARQGPAWEAILEEAAARRCPLVVVGTAGPTRMQALWAGSTAQVVLRRSPVPVLVVPERLGQAPWWAPGARRVLLAASDFSPDAEHALAAALRLAKDLRAEVRLLHAVPGPAASLAGPFDLAPSADLAAAESEAAARLALQASAGRDARVPVVPAVRTGPPAATILTEARLAGAACIVVGTHGRSGLRRFLLGSVTQDLLHAADRPVLVVPHAAAGERGDWVR